MVWQAGCRNDETERLSLCVAPARLVAALLNLMEASRCGPAKNAGRIAVYRLLLLLSPPRPDRASRTRQTPKRARSRCCLRPHRAITPSSVIRNSVSRVGEQGPRSHCTFRWRLVRRDSWHPASKGSEWVLASLREGEEAAGCLDV